MKRKGQSVAEYFITMAVILAAVLLASFIGRFTNAFGVYFEQVAGVITTNR